MFVIIDRPWWLLQILMCLRLIDGVHIITCSQFVAGFPAGCHRYETHRRLGVPTIRCKIRPLSYFDLLLILTDLHHTLIIRSNYLSCLFHFILQASPSSESWYVVFSKRLICNLVWISLLSFAVDSYNVRIKNGFMSCQFLGCPKQFQGFQYDSWWAVQGEWRIWVKLFFYICLTSETRAIFIAFLIIFFVKWEQFLYIL